MSINSSNPKRPNKSSESPYIHLVVGGPLKVPRLFWIVLALAIGIPVALLIGIKIFF